VVYFADLKAVHLQQTTDRSLDLAKRRHDQSARLAGGADELGLDRLHVHLPVMANAHQLGDPPRVILFGLHRPGGEEALRMACFDTDGLEPGGHTMRCGQSESGQDSRPTTSI